jgi:uncharacterized membrane protein
MDKFSQRIGLFALKNTMKTKMTHARSSKTDSQVHIRKRTAGGASGAILGAVVGGPVGALIGGVVGAAVGSVAEDPATAQKLANARRGLKSSTRLKTPAKKTSRTSNAAARSRTTKSKTLAQSNRRGTTARKK